MLDQSQESPLAQIKALIRDADQRLQSVVELLDRIEQPGSGAGGPARAKKAHHLQGARPDRPLLAFVHIPKTAGGTVTTMFAAAWGSKNINKTGNYVTGPEKTVAKVTKRPGGWEAWLRRGGRIAIGHTPYGVFRDLVPQDTRYITFLREPVDRVVSHYYRHVHQPALASAADGTRPRGNKPRAGSLRDALVDMPLPELNNLATRFLCSHPTLDRLPDSALDEAKENLRGFLLVGIQERFEESVVLLQRTLELGMVTTLDRHVSAPGERPAVEEISPEQRAMIEEHNAFDIELYRFGRELFEEAIAAAGEDVTGEADRLREANVAAAEEHKATVERVGGWFDAELPPGTGKPVADVLARSDAAGFSRHAFNEARKNLLIRKEQDDEGVWTVIRPGASELAALREARDWLERQVPAGATLPAPSLFEQAEAAGMSRVALNQARKLMEIVKTVDPDGQLSWTRPDEDAR